MVEECYMMVYFLQIVRAPNHTDLVDLALYGY